MQGSHFKRGFTEGEVLQVRVIEADTDMVHPQGVVKLYTVADLIVASNRVVVCDPYEVYDEVVRVSIPAQPGRYPVIISVAQMPRFQTLLYAMLKLASTSPLRWELLGEYTTSYVRGGFMDSMVADFLSKRVDQEEDYVEYVDSLVAEQLVQHDSNGWSWADVHIRSDSDENFVLFDGLPGTGSYEVVGGYDEFGELSQVVIDYRMICDEE